MCFLWASHFKTNQELGPSCIDNKPTLSGVLIEGCRRPRILAPLEFRPHTKRNWKSVAWNLEWWETPASLTVCVAKEKKLGEAVGFWAALGGRLVAKGCRLATGGPPHPPVLGLNPNHEGNQPSWKAPLPLWRQRYGFCWPPPGTNNKHGHLLNH